VCEILEPASRWFGGIDKERGLENLIERNPLPRGGFLFTVFPDREPGERGPPSKHQVLQGESVLFLRVLDQGK